MYLLNGFSIFSCISAICQKQSESHLIEHLIISKISHFLFYFLGSNVDYVCFEEHLLPVFPLKTPAAFQILESDCKINPALVEQLRFRFLECQINNAEEFINENLNNLLTRMAASVFSWTGTQGNIPLVKFKSMKVLIGWCIFWF